MPALHPDLDPLDAALEMLSWPWFEQRAFLPPDGYSDAGVFEECVLGLRDAMDRCPELLRLGLLRPDVAAEVIACHLFVERLMRDVTVANAQAFAEHPFWHDARALAATAHRALTLA